MRKNITWKHDCDQCIFLGHTLGGKRIVDLYVCESKSESQGSPTLIARYSHDGPDYCSTILRYVRPEGHSELWAAEALYEKYLYEKG